MTIEHAYEVLGEGLAPWSYGFRNMIVALSLMPGLNTPEEDERLRCARWASRHVGAYRAYSMRRRDERLGRPKNF